MQSSSASYSNPQRFASESQISGCAVQHTTQVNSDWKIRKLWPSSVILASASVSSTRFFFGGTSLPTTW